MSLITIRKLNGAGDVLLTYTGEVDAWLPNGVRIVATWEHPRRDLGYTCFETGDLFIEWFFTARWYNIFEVRAAGSRMLKGWYCNVAAPAILRPDGLDCRDLILDVWVYPDGGLLMLDEDEFARATTLDAETRMAAERGRAELVALVEARGPPFDQITARQTLGH
jgi:hypothetical protein